MVAKHLASDFSQATALDDSSIMSEIEDDTQTPPVVKSMGWRNPELVELLHLLDEVWVQKGVRASEVRKRRARLQVMKPKANVQVEAGFGDFPNKVPVNFLTEASRQSLSQIEASTFSWVPAVNLRVMSTALVNQLSKPTPGSST